MPVIYKISGEENKGECVWPLSYTPWHDVRQLASSVYEAICSKTVHLEGKLIASVNKLQFAFNYYISFPHVFMRSLKEIYKMQLEEWAEKLTIVAELVFIHWHL